jgi:class 3 adenylate cyclase
VVEVPQTRYVTVGDAQVAYQVVGEGPRDICYVAGWGHIDVRWEWPAYAAFLQSLASLGRLILFDRRGSGASDAVPDSGIPTWEEWTDDVRAVLDAVGSERTVVFADLDGGPTGLLFTSMHPERVSALILSNTSARRLWAEDYPVGVLPEAVDALLGLIKSSWGTEELAQYVYPDRADDSEFLLWQARYSRAAATPRSAAAQIRYEYEAADARRALPLIQVPTLVLHTKDNLIVPNAEGRWLAEHIKGAKFVEVPAGTPKAALTDEGIAEIAEFLTGERPAVVVDRVLTTVLFTDIVDSTKHAAALGDHRWQELLASHNDTVRTRLRAFRGVEIDTAGDGFFATFDGPARAIRCALAIEEGVEGLGLCVRAGLHTGEVELHDGQLSGLAVHIGARVGATAGPGEILVTRTVTELVVGSGITFSDRGEHQLKGVPGTWQLFLVERE